MGWDLSSMISAKHLQSITLFIDCKDMDSNTGWFNSHTKLLLEQSHGMTNLFSVTNDLWPRRPPPSLLLSVISLPMPVLGIQIHTTFHDYEAAAAGDESIARATDASGTSPNPLIKSLNLSLKGPQSPVARKFILCSAV
jgi:hypothetical protein